MQVSIWMVRALVQAVESCGASREHFLELAELDAAALAQHDLRLSVLDYVRVLDAALAASGDPALGFRMAEQASTTVYHVLAHLVDEAKTLGNALAIVERYSTLFAIGFEPRLVELTDNPERVAFRMPGLCGELPAVRVTAELALAGFVTLLQHFVEAELNGLCVRFAYTTPAHINEYTRVFGAAIGFGARHTELEFPRAWLSCARAYTRPGLYEVLKAHAERELDRLRMDGSMTSRVEHLLTERDPQTLPSLNEVAKLLGISSRTLARKLLREDTSYAALVERRRGTAARCLLESRRLTIKEVADALGFTDPSAFHRAFRRWTGLTPKQYIAGAGHDTRR